jgi:hypothetical protein
VKTEQERSDRQGNVRSRNEVRTREETCKQVETRREKGREDFGGEK